MGRTAKPVYAPPKGSTPPKRPRARAAVAPKPPPEPKPPKPEPVPTIGGVPLAEIEEALVQEMEALAERAEITGVDRALRLVDRARAAGRTTLPAATRSPSPSSSVGVEERMIVLRSCLAAGCSMVELKKDFAVGVRLPDGRRLRMSAREIDGHMGRIAVSGRIDERRRDFADSMRITEMERLARIAAMHETRNPLAALKASEMLLDRVDRYSPPGTAPLDDRVRAVLGTETMDADALRAFYKRHPVEGDEPGEGP